MFNEDTFEKMVCDTLSAGMTYEGKNWTNDFQLGYYLKKHNKINITNNNGCCTSTNHHR